MEGRSPIIDATDHLKKIIADMSSIVIDMVLESTEGAMVSDMSKLQNVIARDSDLDDLAERAVLDTFKVLVLHSPVAKDARFLAGVLAVVGELENAGNDAKKMARRATKMKVPLPDDLQMPLQTLAESVVQMVSDAATLAQEYDSERARSLIDADELIDSGYKQARKRIILMTDTAQPFSRELFRMIEIFHALEHLSDHMVEIARRLTMIYKDAPS